MNLNVIDWIVLLGLTLLFLAIGLSQRRKATSGGLEGYFLAGRKLSWWLAGLSMVATTFAADTPLAVTELVVQNGISGNWLWWNMLAGGMLTVFFFARLWQRAGVLTDVELCELRYSGKAAVLLRGFKAVYLGLIMNSFVIGWVNLALIKIIAVFFNITAPAVLYGLMGAAMVIVSVYCSFSGLAGVALTDAVQFGVAMFGCVVLAYQVLDASAVGGLSGLIVSSPSWRLDFFPTIGQAGSGLAISLGSFLSFVALQWWASWYPGAEPGGGGYIAQRMMSVKSEADAFRATLFFQIAHYAIRPWPWIVVALCVPLLYPELPAERAAEGYVMAMRDYLPAGLKGLMLAAFLAAYMSTVSTQLNWGASYLVNDLYKRLIKPYCSDNQIITISRWTTLGLMVVSFFITTQLKTIKGAWELLLECSAGVGFVLIARWYWWRINVWSEVSAFVAPLAGILILKWFIPSWSSSAAGFAFTVGFSLTITLIITMVTHPEKNETLTTFFAKVKPRGFWGKYATAVSPDPPLGHALLGWVAGIATGYAALFLIGYVIFSRWTEACICLAVLGLGVWVFARMISNPMREV